MANIILCSDGTGNSGGKDNGTNVWRLYQAVDLTGRDQIVFHDDGVGTHEHKILKTIGGAFGWGLSQNIKDLYTSLVRVYNEGDEIFLFGFSRGAYTARALAGLITNFGVLDRYQYRTPGELNKAVDRLFDAYRKLPKHDDPEKSAALNIEEFRKWCCDEWSDQEWDELKNSSEYSVTKREIRFLGVWDTVDAIGVPFDELREWFGPKVLGKRSYDHDLNPRILNVAHAIAIDDQRKTFHPVMFSEGLAGPEQVVDQVWFTGMHSNIGGGYPKDSLSLNTLVWMIDRAIAASVKGKGPVLSFIEGEIDRYRDTANSHGMMYDSRTGVKAFYRYRPRDIEKFCKTACKDGRPVIHESVFERIADRTAGYAPANIPANYRIWTTGEAEDDEASGHLEEL